MKRIGYYIWMLVGCLCGLCGCDPVPADRGTADNLFDNDNGVKITDIRFSDNYKHIMLDVDFLPELNSRVGEDTAMTIRVSEYLNGATFTYDKSGQPVLTEKRDVVAEETTKENLRVLALVDLTLPQPLVDEERNALQTMKNIYDDGKMYVSFMADRKATETLPLTDYVLQNYFLSREGSGKYLFRSIVEKRDEILSPESTFPVTDNMALLVLSDGVVYDPDNQPIDDRYYDFKSELDKPNRATVTDTLSIYYINVGTEDEEDNFEATSTLKRMCKEYDGIYQSSFNWPELEADFKRAFQLDYCDYRLVLTNPDNKLYIGTQHVIYVECYDKNGDMIAADHISYELGNPYEPVIVNGADVKLVALRGGLILLSALFLIYLVFQFLIPYVRYRLFLRRYVVTYRGRNMSVAGNLVADTCYFCKDQFREGDKVVVKCPHTVHKHCWDENEYKCPEYGSHCKEGSHYYNRTDLFDRQNSSFYMMWLMAACLASFCAWVAFLPGLQLFSVGAIIDFYLYFGICKGFFNTLFFSLVSIGHRKLPVKVGSALLRSVMAALCCGLFFQGLDLLSRVVNIDSYSYLISWIPWALSSMLILYLCAYHTRNRVDKRAILVCCVAGVISMGLFTFIYIRPTTDYRLILLLCFMFYSVTLSFCMSHAAFRMEHYFLTVSGSIKPIDIALYKWFKSNPARTVTIGKSVDCDLQMSWEITGIVSPIQAELTMKKGQLWLCAKEEGVKVKGKPLPIDKPVRLHHGSQFTIAQTTFTYKEIGQIYDVLLSVSEKRFFR